jgi:L-rhamnose-H+ transport protein
MITPNPLLGIFFHAVGALSASSCYTPQKKVSNWSWQTYWLTQAAFCWFLLPILGAAITIPHLMQVLIEAPKDAMIISFVLGMAYGIGGTAFGISIRYIGFSLTYAIAVGLSSILGTFVKPLIDYRLKDFFYDLVLTGKWTQPFDGEKLREIFSKTGADWVLTGVFIGAIGIGICGLAGRLKEKHLQDQGEKTEFSLLKGLLLSVLAGVLSAVYSMSLIFGSPIENVAETYGADIWKGNVVYIFSNTGAFVSTAIYCLYLHTKNRTFGEFIKLPASHERASLPFNFLMAALTGLMWYGQFFFYNLGHVRMGEYSFSSWAIHMIMLVLFSNLIGILLLEWKGCRRVTKTTIGIALALLLAAILAITNGNYLGSKSDQSKNIPVKTASES